MNIGNARFKYEEGILTIYHVQWGTENIDYTQAIALEMTPDEFLNFAKTLAAILEKDDQYYKMTKKPEKVSYMNNYYWLTSSGYYHVGTYNGVDVFVVLNMIGRTRFLIFELLSKEGDSKIKYSKRIDVSLGEVN